MEDLVSIAVILAALRKAIRARRKDIQAVVLKDLEARYKQRIFTRGLASNGRNIGQYSTKDMLIGASSFIRKDAAIKAFGKRKRKKSKWVTLGKGPGRKPLMVLEGGYKEFRKLNGRPNAKVDLEFTSSLRDSIQIGTNGGDLVFGYINDKSRIIADSQENRFKKDIFGLSSTEIKAVDKAVIREIDFIVSKVLR